MRYDPSAWFWIVAGDASQVWSSAKPGYVPTNASEYAAFLAAGGTASSIASLAELTEVFVQNYPGGMLATYAADVRWRKEVGGVLVADVHVATDDRSKQMIMGARIAAEADSGFTTPWVGSDGSITTLNSTQVIAISNAVLAHVQSCFATFTTVMTGIDDNTITTRDQIDAAFA